MVRARRSRVRRKDCLLLTYIEPYRLHESFALAAARCLLTFSTSHVTDLHTKLGIDGPIQGRRKVMVLQTWLKRYQSG
jgi:hypothetical protein